DTCLQRRPPARTLALSSVDLLPSAVGARGASPRTILGLDPADSYWVPLIDQLTSATATFNATYARSTHTHARRPRRLAHRATPTAPGARLRRIEAITTRIAVTVAASAMSPSRSSSAGATGL